MFQCCNVSMCQGLKTELLHHETVYRKELERRQDSTALDAKILQEEHRQELQECVREQEERVTALREAQVAAMTLLEASLQEDCNEKVKAGCA